MRIAIVFLTVLCVAAFASVGCAEIGAPFFAVGGIYEDGRMSAGERSFRAVLKRRDAPAVFENMVHSSSPVRQLYGLLGLHLRNPGAFDRELPAFVQRRDSVHVMAGCIAAHEEVGRVAQRIAHGTYDSLIQRPPW